MRRTTRSAFGVRRSAFDLPTGLSSVALAQEGASAKVGVRWTLLVVAAVAFIFIPGMSLAHSVDEKPVTHELRLSDGSRVFGCITAESDTEVEFETIAGVKLLARRDQIVSLRKVEGRLHKGEFQLADPNNTRLFYGPTGRSLPRGQVYLGMYELVMPFVQVGVTDKFSIGGGTPLIFGLDEDFGRRPYWVTPKLQVFNGGKTQVSVGLFQGFGGDDSAGVAYGVATRGGAEGSITAGAGVAYNSNGDRTAVVMIGGDRPISRYTKFVTESYMWQSGHGLASAGVRFFGERISADLAMVMPIGADDWFVLPMINFAYRF